MTTEFEITLKQAKLMRHALGLENGKKKSYRNHYVCCPDRDDHKDWMKLVSAGFATVRKSHLLSPGSDCFWVTTEGAKAVLLDKERLCTEDFPSEK